MPMRRRLTALALVICVAAAVSNAGAGPAPANIQEYYSEVERFIEGRANAIPLGATQIEPLSGGGRYSGEVTMRRAYPASMGPGVECGACTDPCRSFSLAITVVGGNGRFTGDVCLSSGLWRVRNISQQTWISQPQTAPPPPAPSQQPPQSSTIVYRDTEFPEASATIILNNLTRLGYLPSPDASLSVITAQLDVFRNDHAVQFDDEGDQATRAQQLLALVTRTNEAVTRSSAPGDTCEPPQGGPQHRYMMCGRVGRDS